MSEEELASVKAEMVTHSSQLMQARHGNNVGTGKVIAILSGQRTLDGRPKRSELSQLLDATFDV
ncbi:hypothetical protein [Lactiplantibacillus pentosus]|uniref:hypothetical protein n=1 Tax=Lactiplantibacillus pentosus TaxID=1589 RepID=UPI00314053E5